MEEKIKLLIDENKKLKKGGTISSTVEVLHSEVIENDGWINSKTNGKMRLEGKDYIVKDGDVLNFRFNT